MSTKKAYEYVHKSAVYHLVRRIQGDACFNAMYMQKIPLNVGQTAEPDVS